MVLNRKMPISHRLPKKVKTKIYIVKIATEPKVHAYGETFDTISERNFKDLDKIVPAAAVHYIRGLKNRNEKKRFT